MEAKAELGRLIMTGIKGTALVEEEKDFLGRYRIGGVLLFSRNFKDREQLSSLTASIQSLGDEPFLIAVDQEGGRVARFAEPFMKLEPPGVLAKTTRPQAVSEIYKKAALELADCGVNLNLAPVCDLWNNPDNEVIGDRAFGDTAGEVVPFIGPAVRGLRSGGVLTCAKHFIGHGSTEEDSHEALPFVKRPAKELRENEFLPFQEAVSAGVDMVMTGHLIVQAFDKNLPASLSKPIHQILREELNFKGAILTDDLQMKAVTKHFGLKEAALMGLSAGASLLEYRDFGQAKKAYFALCKALESGELRGDIVERESQRMRKEIFTRLK